MAWIRMTGGGGGGGDVPATTITEKVWESTFSRLDISDTTRFTQTTAGDTNTWGYSDAFTYDGYNCFGVTGERAVNKKYYITVKNIGPSIKCKIYCQGGSEGANWDYGFIYQGRFRLTENYSAAPTALATNIGGTSYTPVWTSEFFWGHNDILTIGWVEDGTNQVSPDNMGLAFYEIQLEDV